MINSILYYQKAFSFILKNRLGYFFIFPFLVGLAMFVIGNMAVSSLTILVMDTIEKQLQSMAITENFGFLEGAIYWLVWLGLKLAFFALYAVIGGYLVLIIISPVLSVLANKIYDIKTGQNEKFAIKQFLIDVYRGVVLVIRNSVIELILTILLLIMGFVPLLGTLAPFMILLITAYFYGFSFLDYSLERLKLSRKESIDYVKKIKWKSIGIGAPFTLCFLIPVVGSVAASFLSIVSCAAATLLIIDEHNKK